MFFAKHLLTSGEASLNPFFSVLVPVYNRPDYLRECIDSILVQDFDDFEIILSDDNSPRIEEISDIIQPYLDRFSNVHFIRQPQNLGWSENRNFLVNSANGKYVLLMGDDDKLPPFALGRLRHYIDAYPNSHIYTIGFNLINEDGKLGYSCRSPQVLEIDLHHENLTRELFFSDIIPFWVFHPFTMCYQKVLCKEVRYRREAHIGDDILFLLECANLEKQILVVPEVLFSWRKARGQRSNYKNLSTDGLNSIIARRNILGILRTHKSLRPDIVDIISSLTFRKRFLYYSVLLSKDMNSTSIQGLNLADDNYKELKGMYDNRHSCLSVWTKVKLIHLRSYLRIFGFIGLLHLLSMAYSRLSLKIRDNLLATKTSGK